MTLSFEILSKINLNDIDKLQILFPHWKRKSILKKINETENKKDIRAIARFDGQIIAHIKAKPHKDIHEHRVDISSMMVAKEYRRRRVGEKLIKFLIKNLPKSTKLILLEVDEKNTPARKLYKKLGFKKYGYLKKAAKVRDKYLNNLLLVKELN